MKPPRRLARRVGCGALAGLALAAFADAQSAPREILGRVRTESGRGVEDARIVFLPDAPHGLSWLAALDAPPPPQEFRSGADGRFRSEVRAGAGALWVETADGLGALVERVVAGAPLMVVARPLGEVSRYDGSELAAQLRWLPRSGRSIPLGERRGARLRLPAGRLALLVEEADRLVETRVDVPSGLRLAIGLPDDRGPKLPPELAADPTTRWSLRRWPELADARRDGRLPRLQAHDSLLVRRTEAEGLRFASCWSGDRTLALAFPAGDWRSVRVVGGEPRVPLAGARVLTIAIAAGGVRVLAESWSDGDGLAHGFLAAERDEPHRLVVLTRDGAVHGAAIEVLQSEAAPEAAPAELAMPAADELRVRVVDAAGGAIADATVTLVDPAERALDRAFASDARGIVALVAVPRGAVTLRVDSGRHVPAEFVCGPTEPRIPLRELVLAQGRPLDVRVLQPDGSPAIDVDVELRDPSGTTGITPRHAATDGEGRCRFEGLPDGSYALFASAMPGGITWSGRRIGAQPGEEEWTIVVRSEDPALPGRRD
ncbi:MAG: carboxypeptidase regulatory-like domain-containing protein [Planctomycetes bacterium]|nr:carboxypeptidase regulatory-like domain-containing protein [Planctomycetota bacterium]